MGTFSDLYENLLLKHIFNIAALTPPTIWVALSKYDPGDDGVGLTEPAVGDYARVQASTWLTAANRLTKNSGPIIFPEATAAWGTITHAALMTAQTSGNMIAWAALSASRTVTTGQQVALADQEISVGWDRWRLDFTSGGAYQVLVGDTLIGNTSAATGIVAAVTVSTGSWANGDAAGCFLINTTNGTYLSETLSVGGYSDVATTDGALVGGISTYLAHKMLDLIFSGTSYTHPTVYAALSTANPKDDKSGLAEPSGANYARVAVSAWTTPTIGLTDNTNAITFANPSGAWGALTYGALLDALTVGNLLFYGKLTTSVSPVSGDTVQFGAGNLDVRIDPSGEPGGTTTT